MYILGQYKFKCLVYPTIENIKNMHVVLANQIVDVLHFNNNSCYLTVPSAIWERFSEFLN